MASLEYFLVSESYAVDQFTNRVSLFHVLEEAHVGKFPAIIPQIVAASSWLKDDSASEDETDFQVLLKVSLPGVEEPEEITSNFHFGKKPRIRIQHALHNLKIEHVGHIRFEVLLNGKHKASHLFTIVQAGEEVDPDMGK